MEDTRRQPAAPTRPPAAPTRLPATSTRPSAASTRLLAGSTRPRAVATLAGCAILVAVLGALFAHQTTADGFDRVIDAPLVTLFSGHSALADVFAFPGTTIPAVVLNAVMVVVCLLARRIDGAVLAAVAVPAAVGLNDALLKPWVHRSYLGQPAYPSGHTASVSALAATTIVLLLASARPTRRPTRWLRRLILVVTYLLTVSVVVGVIGMPYHYFTDTVAGAAVGTGTVCALALLLDLIPAVRPRNPAVRPRIPAVRPRNPVLRPSRIRAARPSRTPRRSAAS
jgi:membrane-associated phospholipid phosphatase